jgi:WD40 repeat protein
MIWDPVTGQPYDSAMEGVSLKFAICFSPDSRYLLAEGNSGTIGVWDVQSRQNVGSFGQTQTHREVKCIAFSPNRERFLSAGLDFKVKVWPWRSDRIQSVETPGLELDEVKTSGLTNRAVFSADGKRLITIGDVHTVKIWDASSGRLIDTLFGHTGDVYAVAVSRDGKWLASGAQDATVRLWDIETKDALTLRGHTETISSLAFSPDSRLLASGSWDHTVKVWELDRISGKRK